MTARVPLVIVVMVLLAGCLGGMSGTDNNTSSVTTATTGTPSTVTTTNGNAGSTATSPTQMDPPTSETAAPTATSTSAPTSTHRPSSTPTSSSTVTSSPDSQSDENTPTSNTTTAPSRENPWGKRTLTMAIKNENGNDRAFKPLVQNALAYWEENSRQYAGYSVNYRLTNAANPDVNISFVSVIENCGGKKHVEGCAPFIRSSEQVNQLGTVQVQIRDDYTNESTTQLLIHEFGHTLGLDHDDAPKDIMAAESDLTARAKPNVTERAVPWDHSTLTVAIDSATVPEGKRRAVNQQVKTALDYYTRGAAGTVPDRVSFRRVSNTENADIVVRFSQDPPCDIVSGSCSIASGYNLDTDDALEMYHQTVITLKNVDTDTIGWHVANRIGADAFGFDESSDFPTPLRDTAPLDVRQSRWWE